MLYTEPLELNINGFPNDTKYILAMVVNCPKYSIKWPAIYIPRKEETQDISFFTDKQMQMAHHQLG